MLPSVCTNDHCILGPAPWARRAAKRDTETFLEEACLTHGPEDTAIMEQREGQVLGAAWSAMPVDNRDRNSMLGFLSFSPFTQFNSETVRVQGGHQLLS